VIATTLGVIGTVLGVLRAWPQVREIVVRRQTAGVSVQTWALTLLNNASWLLLGVIIGAVPIVISNLLSAVGSIAVLTAIQRQLPRQRLARSACAAVVGAALVGLTSIGGATALTALATVLAITMFMPQLFLVLRSGAVGVSVTTWLLSAVCAAVWLFYAFALGRPSIAVCQVVILPASLVITQRARRQQAARPTARRGHVAMIR
jgi:MtN3 and saliva related transmembrane protein